MPVLDRPSELLWPGSPMPRLDPRGRVIVAALFALVVSLVDRPTPLALAVGLSLLAAAVARLKFLVALQRLLPINGFLLLVILVLPWSAPGTPLVRFGPLAYSREGFSLAAEIAVKANAIAIMLVVMLAALDVVTLGHALRHLYAPEKLTHLLLFTVRYIDVLEREFRRLLAAMRVRGFQPRMDRHTYRAYGYLVGMLLVRSLDRSERIVAAMACRGFRGRFYLLDHFAASAVDVAFGATAIVALGSLAVLQWAI